MERDSLIFYQSFAKAVKRLKDKDGKPDVEQQLKALWAIIDYGLEGVEPDLEDDGFYMAIFEMARPQIDANVKRKVDGCRGGRPRTSGCAETETTGYETEKPNVKEKVKEKVKENIKTICPEPGKSSAPDSPVAAAFILNDKSMYNVTENDVVYYQQLYPGIDCMQELRKLTGWCESNPKLRKTRSGAKRFMNSWFARAQDEATRHTGRSAPVKKNNFKNFEERNTDYDAMVNDMAREMIGQE